MADRCPHCGAANPENLPFCGNCSEPIDPDLRLIMDLEKMTKPKPQPKPSAQYWDDDEIPKREEEKDFPIWIPILIVAVVAAAAFLLLK